MPTTDQYLSMAAASDRFEIESANLELGSKNPAIHDFAQQMITDHTQSSMMLKDAASRDGWKPSPPMLNSDQQKMLAKLKAATGSGRDMLYITQQRFAHDKALKLHSDYAANGDKPAVRAVAQQIVPVVQHHIGMLSSMPM
jgi:putative membrane protein